MRPTIVCVLALLPSVALAQNAPVTVAIDAQKNRHAISPLIYGVAFASPADLQALRATLNRNGGNNTSTYSYAANAQNLDADYFFESYPQPGTVPGAEPDAFVSGTNGAGSAAMLTLPLIGWVAKLGPNRGILPSFSVAKYGPQCAVDPYDTDAGDGLHTDCATPITGNDPNDAYVPSSPAREAPWVRHVVKKFGGVPYWLMDNEASIWFSTHRDVHPLGPHATEYRDAVLHAAAMLRKTDPAAKIAAPEEWGWEGYFYSGYDQQYAAAHNYCCYPDHMTQQGGLDYIPWLLKEWAPTHAIDALTVHFYPQGGEFSNDVSTNTELLRNRSTRQLWDPNYISESWINAPVYLIPRLQGYIANYYAAGTPVGVTEYNWGAEPYINGATAQADIWGIFGAYGLDIATRWTVPANTTPTYKAMQIYRNYDGAGSAFGDTSIAAAVPNPDNLSAFASLRTSDGALTVMVVNKVLSGTTPVTLSLANLPGSGTAQRWQLTSSNTIAHLADLPYTGGTVADTLPAQSITLYVVAP